MGLFPCVLVQIKTNVQRIQYIQYSAQDYDNDMQCVVSEEPVISAYRSHLLQLGKCVPFPRKRGKIFIMYLQYYILYVTTAHLCGRLIIYNHHLAGYLC